MNSTFIHIIKRHFLLGLFLLLGFLISCKNKASEEKQETPHDNNDNRPNIVIIMADDMGFSDLGCYGGEINTPNLNKLASNGIQLNSFYNTSRCCPTRASLLTGLYPHKAGIGRMTTDMDLPGYQGKLSDSAVTIAQVLKSAGYQTGMVGKWHVSETNALDKEKQLKWLSHQDDYGDFADTSSYPTSKGFDKYYGNIWGVVDYYDPFSLVNGTKPVKNVPDDFYYTRAIGDSAVSYVNQFSKKDEPFFLYVAHCAPHWPLQAPDSAIAKYENTYKKGWRAIRAKRYQQLIEKGFLQADDATLTPFMFSKLEWESNKDKEWDSRAMATHAAMVDILDQTIGNLVDELEKSGEMENTVIFFMSDNGASYERPSQFGPGFDRAGSTREGKVVHFPVDKDFLPGPQTVNSGIGPQWAHVSNTPFKYWKSKVYEGGITSPFIVHWSKGITNKNTIRTQQAHIIDLMPTCMELAGATYPKEFNNHKINPYQGKSILPLIEDSKSPEIHDELFWEHFGAAALRQGKWKIVRLNEKKDWELYDLSTDRTENNNIAFEHPKVLSKMIERWEELAHENLVYPAP